MSRSGIARRLGLLAVASSAAVACFAVVPAADAAAPAANPTLTVRYDASGKSTIGSIKADLPIAPTKLEATLDLVNYKILRGTFPIKPQTIYFQGLGFIPLRATASLVQASPLTGSLTPTDDGNIFKGSLKYTIKLSKVQVNFLGAWLDLGIGNNCQTINPINVSIASPKGQYFDIFSGGNVAGGYTIGNFKDCAPLHLPDFFGIGSLPVNALVPGSNNTINVKVTDGEFVGSTE